MFANSRWNRTVKITLLGLAIGSPALSSVAVGAEWYDKFKAPFASKPAANPDTSLKTTEPAKPATAKPASKSAADPKNVNGLSGDMAKGRMLERSNEWEKARKIYEGVLSQNPNDAAARHRLGVVADQQRRYTEAQNHFTEALRLRPRDAEIFNDLGYCFFLQGKLDKAQSALTKATQLDPKNGRYRNNLGMVLGHQGKHQQAFAEFAQTGSDADAFYNLAFIYTSQDQADKAKECFRRALAVDPKHELARKALQSFQLYDSSDPSTRDIEFNKNGVRMVPYIEGESASVGATVPASANMPVNSQAITPRMADGAARSMQQQSRGLLNRNMASNREAPGSPPPQP